MPCYDMLSCLKCMYRHTLFYCIQALLHFAIYTLKVCGNLVLSESVSTIFPTTFAHCMSLCTILVILTVIYTFSLFLYL